MSNGRHDVIKVIDDEPWVPLVGQFMLAFGSIESSVNELLRQQCTKAQMRFIVSLQLAQRFILLREVLTERQLDQVSMGILIANLDEAQSLAKTRNLIAHNPLVLAMFDDKGTSSKSLQEVIAAEHSGKQMDLAELSKLTERAVKVAEALTQNWIEFDLAEMDRRPPALKRP